MYILSGVSQSLLSGVHNVCTTFAIMSNYKCSNAYSNKCQWSTHHICMHSCQVVWVVSMWYPSCNKLTMNEMQDEQENFIKASSYV